MEPFSRKKRQTSASYSPGYSPGAAAPALAVLEVVMDPQWMQISSRAAGWTNRLNVFKEVHLESTPSLQTSFEHVD